MRNTIKGFERREHNNLVSCCVNGDRRFLHDVTKDNIRNVGQKSRTNPSLRQQKTHFCLPTKVRFLNDVCLRQMILASPSDDCLA